VTAKTEYKKELFSLPVDVSEALKAYAKETHKKKSHIVAEAIAEYVKKEEEKQLLEDALSLIGSVKGSVPDIQDIKANRDDV